MAHSIFEEAIFYSTVNFLVNEINLIYLDCYVSSSVPELSGENNNKKQTEKETFQIYIQAVYKIQTQEKYSQTTQKIVNLTNYSNTERPASEHNLFNRSIRNN